MYQQMQPNELNPPSGMQLMNQNGYGKQLRNGNPFQHNGPQYNGSAYRPVPPLQGGNQYDMAQQHRFYGQQSQQQQLQHPPNGNPNNDEQDPSDQPLPIQDESMNHQQNNNGHSSAPWNNADRANDAYNSYHHQAESDDSPSDHEQDDDSNEHELVRIQSHADDQLQAANPQHAQHPPHPQRLPNSQQSRPPIHGNHAMHRSVDMHLPEIPDIPAMPQIEDVDMKPEELKLHRHVGFVLKLNARLTQLNAECSILYPKLAKDLVDSKLAELSKAEFKQLAEDKISLTHKCAEYESKIQTLLPIQEQNTKLHIEMDKMRKLINTYSSKEHFQQQDYREMLSSQSREYVTELQRQLDLYRRKVVSLSQQSQSCMAAIKNSVQHQQKAQESINDATDQLRAANEHIKYLEDNEEEQERARSLEQKVQALTTSHQHEIEKMQFENAKLQNDLDALQQQQKTVQSEKIANKAQIEEHIQYKYQSQLQQLEERLSKMTVQRITMEDEFQQKQKQEQERADRYRAKYESVKQHVKTLEMQKGEYTRVNVQLRQQNNQFRSMITSLQNELKGLANRHPHHMGGANHSGMGGVGGPVQREMSNQSDLEHSPMRQQLMRLQQQQNMLGAQNQFNRDMQGMGGMGAMGGNGNNPMMNGMGGNNVMNKQMMNRNGHQPLPSDSMSYANANPLLAGGGGGIGGPVQRGNSQPQRLGSAPKRVGSEPEQLWGKTTKTISEKGSKKRVLVEWHFVTSDDQPHAVILQHTQDTRLKTRRMLWVDGSEKYNNKSSASSFRIEIDKDVVVVSIDQLEQYQYRLTINNASFTDAHSLWSQKNQQFQ